MLQWWWGGGGVVEFFLTLAFFGGLNFFLRDYTLIKHIFPDRGMSFLSALSIFFGQGGGGGG